MFPKTLTMKSVIITLLALATTAQARNNQYYDFLKDNTAFGYYRKIGIPLAKEILKTESITVMKPKLTIARGSVAREGQIPYQAALLTEFRNFVGHGVCGGSLVSNSRVLTAAHCWFDGEQQASGVTVVLGSAMLYYGGVRIFTNNVVMHPNWIPQIIRNDIAMIYLPNAVSFSEIIAPIALPSGNELNEDYAGYTAVASGFGHINDYTDISNWQVLSHVKLRVISNSECVRAFRIVMPTNICTSGAQGRSTCQGDSGGPLVVYRRNKYILIGITSFGSEGHCELGAPAGFTRVSSYMNFITRHL